MKRTLLLLTSLTSLVATQLASADQSPCFKKSGTQLELNECAAKDYQQADAELNKVYRQVLAMYANDPGGVVRIKKAQRAWIAFRDAQIDALFPESDRGQVGSAFAMCRAMELAKLTNERTKALKAMLNHQEGDVCSQ